MKKVYISPIAEIVMVGAEAILAGSPTTGTGDLTGGGTGGPTGTGEDGKVQDTTDDNAETAKPGHFTPWNWDE